jgi:hypothetical protein
MNKDQLAAEILDQSHRPDLNAKTDVFINLAEGMIARDVRANEQITSVVMTDADRQTPGETVYVLPDDYLYDRAVWSSDSDYSRVLEKKGLAEIRRLAKSAIPSWFAVSGLTIDFRGNPSEGSSLELEYFARLPALLLGTDSNAVLEDHPEIYLASSLFFLYRYTQDMELAQGFLDSFTHASKMLNEIAATKIGGGSIAPAYNFNPTSSQ